MGEAFRMVCARALFLFAQQSPVLVRIGIHTATHRNAGTGETAETLLLTVFDGDNPQDNHHVLTVPTHEIDTLIKQLETVRDMLQAGERMPVIDEGRTLVREEQPRRRATRRRKPRPS